MKCMYTKNGSFLIYSKKTGWSKTFVNDCNGVEVVEAFCSKVCQISQGLLTIYFLFHFDLDVLCFSLLEHYLNKGYIYSVSHKCT